MQTRNWHLLNSIYNKIRHVQHLLSPCYSDLCSVFDHFISGPLKLSPFNWVQLEAQGWRNSPKVMGLTTKTIFQSLVSGPEAWIRPHIRSSSSNARILFCRWSSAFASTAFKFRFDRHILAVLSERLGVTESEHATIQVLAPTVPPLMGHLLATDG